MIHPIGFRVLGFEESGRVGLFFLCTISHSLVSSFHDALLHLNHFLHQIQNEIITTYLQIRVEECGFSLLRCGSVHCENTESSM